MDLARILVPDLRDFLSPTYTFRTFPRRISTPSLFPQHQTILYWISGHPIWFPATAITFQVHNNSYLLPARVISLFDSPSSTVATSGGGALSLYNWLVCFSTSTTRTHLLQIPPARWRISFTATSANYWHSTSADPDGSALR